VARKTYSDHITYSQLHTHTHKQNKHTHTHARAHSRQCTHTQLHMHAWTQMSTQAEAALWRQSDLAAAAEARAGVVGCPSASSRQAASDAKNKVSETMRSERDTKRNITRVHTCMHIPCSLPAVRDFLAASTRAISSDEQTSSSTCYACLPQLHQAQTHLTNVYRRVCRVGKR
jgi:hypothetical protein